MSKSLRFIPVVIPLVLICSLSCQQSNPNVKQEDKKHLAGVWINKTVLDAACTLGPYFDSSIFWNATQLIIDSNHLNACLLINDDSEQSTFALQYSKKRIMLFEPGVADSIMMQYDEEKDHIIMHDMMAKADFEFVRVPEKKDKDVFKKRLRQCWLSGNYQATWGSFRQMDEGVGELSLADDGHITGWDRANRFDVFINGDYASFADHPVMVLYKDSLEELYVWNKRGDTIELFKPSTLYDAGEKPYYGKGVLWATLIKQK